MLGHILPGVTFNLERALASEQKDRACSQVRVDGFAAKDHRHTHGRGSNQIRNAGVIGLNNLCGSD